MAIAVAQVGGNTSTAINGISFTFGSSTTSGSGIILLGLEYNTSGSAAAGDFTDNKSNTYQLAGSLMGGANSVGVECGYNTISTGTRGASHQCTVNGPGAGESINAAGIEITGHDSTTTTSAFDSASFATANDATSAWTVTAAAAVASGVIGIYGVAIDTGTNNAFTQPTGYTNISNQPDGTSFLVSCASYKLSESGTPSVGATSGHTAGSGSAREIFAAFKPAAGAATKALPFPPNRIRPPILRRK
jgi:hypothetical protein